MSEPTTRTTAGSGEGQEDPGAARVVVGVDGSPGAFTALVWALASAARSGAPVEVVSAFPVDDYFIDPRLADPRRIDTIRSDTEARARAFLARAMSDPAVTAVPRATAIPVYVTVVAGHPSEHLVSLSRGARMLVVGSRGRGGLRSTLLGSVALHCSTHAPCPVVVVPRAGQPTTARVVVGIDESAVSRAALLRAAEEAARLGAELEAVAVHQPVTYWSDLSVAAPPPVEESLPELRRRAKGLVAETLGPDPREYVRVVADVGAPADVLVRRAEGAELLVVGSRSRSRLTGMLLGSVALHCIVHAPCPVMVVHPEPVRAGTAEHETAVPAHA